MMTTPPATSPTMVPEEMLAFPSPFALAAGFDSLGVTAGIVAGVAAVSEKANVSPVETVVKTSGSTAEEEEGASEKTMV